MRQWVISIIIIVFISSCQKQVAYLTVEDKIADKEWFLERYVAPGVNIIYKGKKYPILSKKFITMKKILGIVLLLGLVAFSTEKVYIFRFTEPQINFHWQNLEAIKQIMDQSALPHNQVKQAVNAIDSLQKDMRMVLAIDKIRMKVDEK